MISSIITNIVTTIVVGAIGVIISLVVPFTMVAYKQLVEKLPSGARAVLWDYANTVVKSVEQQFADWTPEQKKAFAVEEIQKLLKKAGISLPGELIDHVIEQVVFELRKEQSALK